MRDDDNVEVIPGDVLVGKVSEHGRDEGRCPVIHVQSRLALRESVLSGGGGLSIGWGSWYIGHTPR